jgi:hypothetical protein
MLYRSWLRHYATYQKVAGSISEEAIGFLNVSISSSRNIALGPAQPLTEMKTRNFTPGKVRATRKADNLTAICEPAV